MIPERSGTLEVRVVGDGACFTMGEAKVERVSFPCPTPSATRGVLEAVFYHPQMRYVIEHLKMIKMGSLTEPVCRNELKQTFHEKKYWPTPELVEHGGMYPQFYIEDERTQRHTVALKGPLEYIIGFHIELTEKAKPPQDNIPKYVEMLMRRVKKGQYYLKPYLGMREYPAEVFPVEGNPTPVPITEDLGLMTWDFDYAGSGMPVVYRAKMENGVILVPHTIAEARASARQEIA